MPGKIHSKSQMRKMFALEAQGKLARGKAAEMAHAEGHKRLAKLPEKVKDGGPAPHLIAALHKAYGGCAHMAHGGVINEHSETCPDEDTTGDGPENADSAYFLETSRQRKSSAP